jgi:hypothetical protein
VHLRAAAVGAVDRELRADKHGAFAHSADTARERDVWRIDAAAVVADDERRISLEAIETELDMVGVGVSSHVRERFLCDASDDQLLLLRERESCVEVATDVEVCLLCHAVGQGTESARESEVVERLGPQPAGDPADLLGALTGRLAQLVELFAQVLGNAAARPSTCSMTPVSV